VTGGVVSGDSVEKRLAKVYFRKYFILAIPKGHRQNYTEKHRKK